MKDTKIKTIIDDLQSQVASLDTAPPLVKALLNLVESLVEKTDKLEEENQQLKNENNKLKGETVPPKVRKQTDKKSNHSSEAERKRRSAREKPKKGGTKKSKVKIDRAQKLTIAPEALPKDAKLAGVKKTVIQDVKFVTDTVEFERQMYYSKSENKTYTAPLPPGYEGEYGPTIKSWTKAFYSEAKMTQGTIAWVFNTVGSVISKTTISRMLTGKANEPFHEEKESIVKAGLKSTSYQHLDDTSGRESGQNRYVNVLANEYYSAFFTLMKKDRLSVIEMLSVGELKFLFNELAFELMDVMNIPPKHIEILKESTSTDYCKRPEVDKLLAQIFPNPKKHQNYRKLILEATAIAAYRKSEYAIKHLIVDDAPQFKLITDYLGLCWVHEGRHYKKLNPVFKSHQTILEHFLDDFWDYYRKLLVYKQTPSTELALSLTNQFEELFSQNTDYEKLNQQLLKTKVKQKKLLLVLDYPDIPLHNNPAELAARVQARTRDVHLHTMSASGTKIKDTLATLAVTAKKLNVNFFNYLYDRITKHYEMTSLAELITLKSKADKKLSNAQLVPT